MSDYPSDWELVPIREIIAESRINPESDDPSKRISVRLHCEGVEKRSERATDQAGATRYYKRLAGQFIYGKQNLHKGAVGIVPDELHGFCSSQDIPAFDISPSVDPNWFLYLFRQRNFYESLENIATGTGSKRIQPSELGEKEIAVPPLPEQKKIAEILSGIDRVTNRLSGKLTKKGSLLTALLDDQFSSCSESDGALLEDIAEYITYGLTVRPKYVDHGVPMISAGECRNGYLDFAASKKISEDDFANVRSKTIPKQGDLLVTKTGTLGRVAVVPEDCPEFTITQNVALIRPLNNAVHSGYLSYYLRSPVCQKEIRDKTSVLAIPDLQLGMLGRFFIPLPSASQQEKASSFLASIEHHIALIRKELDALLSLRQSVAGDLLSGRKRVSV